MNTYCEDKIIRPLAGFCCASPEALIITPQSAVKQAMKKTDNKALNVVEQHGQASLSPAQKIFNALLRKLETERQLLAAWQEVIPLHQQYYASQYQPLMRSYHALVAQLVRLLDDAYSAKGLSRHDQEKISHIICSVGATIIVDSDAADLKRIYRMHGGAAVDAAEGQPEDLAESGQEADSDPHASAEQQREHARAAKRKKSAKAAAREAQQQEELHKASQSVREVYRKLASALHPDREQDPLEHARKTALMQRVNIAYDKKDLLGLLELQLEIEQIDQSRINFLSEQHLQHYSKVLTEQSAELRDEIAGLEAEFRMRFNLGLQEAMSPLLAMRHLKSAAKSIQQNIHALKNDLLAFEDIKNIKAWLKNYHI
ncbi:dnaJ domain protein [Collimonas pratensis]|uniref:DnaJ domain protein n=2 Tax=Collimonas pratensis TaxID=279113 RepID=A0ABM5ZBM3_9BURK|nr:dnaJ domain protein [Collimonas pratensis]